jgi:hypothetical protein
LLIAGVSVGKRKKKEKRVKGERFRVPENELRAVKRRAKKRWDAESGRRTGGGGAREATRREERRGGWRAGVLAVACHGYKK